MEYCVDNEICAEIYQEYNKIDNLDFEQLNRLGISYIPFLDEYALEESTVWIIRNLAKIKDESILEVLDTKIMHGYLRAKHAMRQEIRSYRAFTMLFDEDIRRGLNGLLKYVVNQKVIPYKIRNRQFHIDVLDSPAMVLSLDFENVLIEDGRHPKEILITHIGGEVFTVSDSEGERQMYRLRFVNGLCEGRYPVKENAFVFTGLKGTLKLCNYDYSSEILSPEADKVPWRLLIQPMHALMDKAKILGIKYLNAHEIENLPLLCVFYELIQFYLDDGTIPGIGRSAIHYRNELVHDFAFSDEDIANASGILETYGETSFAEHLSAFSNDPDAFCRYWIQFATNRRADTLYRVLKGIVSRCASDYNAAPPSLTYSKHYMLIRRLCQSYYAHRGWSGEYPLFKRVEQPKFLEVSNVYQKMYTYINEKCKAYYLDFIESTNDTFYTITAVAGYVIMKDEEDMQEYSAVSGYFLDGGRRNSHLVGTVTIDNMMKTEEIKAAVAELFAHVDEIFGI